MLGRRVGFLRNRNKKGGRHKGNEMVQTQAVFDECLFRWQVAHLVSQQQQKLAKNARATKKTTRKEVH